MFEIYKEGKLILQAPNTTVLEGLALWSTNRYDPPGVGGTPFRIEPSASAGSATSVLGDMSPLATLGGSRDAGFFPGYVSTRFTSFVSWNNNTLAAINVSAAYIYATGFTDVYYNTPAEYLLATSSFPTITIDPGDGYSVRYTLGAGISL